MKTNTINQLAIVVLYTVSYVSIDSKPNKYDKIIKIGKRITSKLDWKHENNMIYVKKENDLYFKLNINRLHAACKLSNTICESVVESELFRNNFIPPPKLKILRVNNFYELIQSIRPSSTIYLNTSKIKFNFDSKNSRLNSNPYVTVTKDSFEVHNIYDFAIIGQNNVTDFISESKQRTFFSFMNSQNILLKNLKFTSKAGFMSTSLAIEHTSEIQVNNCTFNGEGAIGLTLLNVDKAILIQCTVEDKDLVAIVLENTSNIFFKGLIIQNNSTAGPLLFSNNSEVSIEKMKIFRNNGIVNRKKGVLNAIINANKSKVTIVNSEIYDNKFDTVTKGVKIILDKVLQRSNRGK